MSDFLNKFEDSKYESTIKDKNVLNSKEKNGIERVNHDLEIDGTYYNKKLIRYIIVAIVVIVLAIVALLIYLSNNKIEIKDFVNQNIKEARTWALKNKIEIEEEMVFDLIDTGKIVSQSLEKYTTVSKKSIIKFTISKGPDQDEIITLPDFLNMNKMQIEEWIKVNKMKNVVIAEEFNDKVERGNYTRKEHKLADTLDENYTRKNILSIYISKGPESEDKSVKVLDFIGKTKTEIEEWIKTNNINVTYKKEGSNTIVEGNIISQSIVSGEMIARGTNLELIISLGKGVVVPNYSKYTAETASSVEPGIMANVITKYSETISYGNLISQSIKSGIKVFEENKVNVVYSEGKPYLEDLKGESEKSIPKIFAEFNQKGVKVTYNISYVDSYQKKGEVVWVSKYAEYLNMKDHIEVHISKGNLTNPLTNQNQVDQ